MLPASRQLWPLKRFPMFDLPLAANRGRRCVPQAFQRNALVAQLLGRLDHIAIPGTATVTMTAP
jgi:hypothetical protein